MADPNAPFRHVLWLASDRFYKNSTDLSRHLDIDPQGTLYRISAAPLEFGDIKPCLDDAKFRKAHNNLITAARAYIVNARKMTAEAIDQPDLPLDDNQNA